MGCTPLPGNNEMVAKIDLLGQRAAHMTPAIVATLDAYHRIESARFAAEGPGWQALAQSTIEARELLGFADGPILSRTMMLEESFVGAGQMSEVVTADGWESISNVAYAGYHQYGMGRNPTRKEVDLKPSTALMFAVILQGYLNTGAASTASAGEIASVL